MPNAPGVTIALIGLGLVGNAIAHRMRAAGFTVVGYDVSVAAREAFRAGRIATSAAEAAAGARVVVLAVFDTQGTVSALEGAQGVLRTATPQAVIDCSTGDPDALVALAQRLAARGTAFIEAPLSGSSAQIAAGEATMLLAGDLDAISAQAPVLDAISSHRIHVGATGMGARAKLATNLVLGLNRAALAEGMVFAERLGIAPDRFLELVLASPARSDAALVKGPAMVDGDFAPRSRIVQHLKDVELMLAQAGARGQGLPLSAAHAQLLRSAVAAGDGELDNAAIVRQLRRETR